MNTDYRFKKDGLMTDYRFRFRGLNRDMKVSQLKVAEYIYL